MLKPDSRGILVPTKPGIKGIANATPYTRPSQALIRLDRIRSGDTPRIAITRTQGGIGDVMMTLPTVKAISLKYNTKVDYGTDFTYLHGALPKVLRGIPYINQVLPWKDIDESQYDVLLDLTCPCVAHERAKAPPLGRIELFARHAQLSLVDTKIDYVFDPKELEEAKVFLQSKGLYGLGLKLVMIQPASSTSRRDVPANTLQQIALKIAQANKNIRLLVVSHDTDNDKSQNWNFREVTRLHNMDIRQLAAIMNYCSLVLCQDSAILHLAGALEKASFSFFGPTDPRARINTYRNAVSIWGGHNLACCPCWYDACKVGYTCWKMTNVNVSVETILAMIDNKPLPNYRELVSFNYNLPNKPGTQSFGELI